MKIGKNCRMTGELSVFEPYLVEVGDNVTFSSECAFLTHDNSVSKLNKASTDVFGKIVIGNNVFIGYGAIVLPGVTIADNCIIAAGSVVTHSFSESKIIAGNPAREVREINQEYIDKASEKAFDMRGLSFEGRKSAILSEPAKLIKKATE